MGAGGSTTSKSAEKTSSGMVSGASKGAVGGYSGGSATGGASLGGKSSGPGGAGGVRNTSTGTRQASTSAAVGGKQSAASSPGGKQSGPGGAGGVRSTSGGDRQSATAAAVGGGGLGGGDRGGKGGTVGGGIGGGGLRGGDPGVAGVPGGLTGRGAPVGGGIGPSGGGQGGLGRIGGPPVANTAMGFQGLTGVAPGPAPGPNQRSRSPGPVSGGMPVSGVPRAAPSPGLGSPQPIGGGITGPGFGGFTPGDYSARDFGPTMADIAQANPGFATPGFTPGAYGPQPGVPGSMPSMVPSAPKDQSRLDAANNLADLGALTTGLPVTDSMVQPNSPAIGTRKDQDSLAEVNAPHPVARDPTYDATTGPYGAYNPAGLGAPGMGAYGLSPRQGVPQAPGVDLTSFDPNAPDPSQLTNAGLGRQLAMRQAPQAAPTRGPVMASSDPAAAARRGLAGAPNPGLDPSSVASLPGEYGGLPTPGLDDPAAAARRGLVPGQPPVTAGYSNPARSFANIPQRAPPQVMADYDPLSSIAPPAPLQARAPKDPSRLKEFAEDRLPQETLTFADDPAAAARRGLVPGTTPPSFESARRQVSDPGLLATMAQAGVPQTGVTSVSNTPLTSPAPQPGPPQVLSGQPPIDDLNQALDVTNAQKTRAFTTGKLPNQQIGANYDVVSPEVATALKLAGGMIPGFAPGVGTAVFNAARENAARNYGYAGPTLTGMDHPEAYVGGAQGGANQPRETRKEKRTTKAERLAKAIDEWNWTITDNPLPTSATF